MKVKVDNQIARRGLKTGQIADLCSEVMLVTLILKDMISPKVAKRAVIDGVFKFVEFTIVEIDESESKVEVFQHTPSRKLLLTFTG